MSKVLGSCKKNSARITLLVISIIVALVIAEIALRLIGFRFVLYPSKVQFGWPDPVRIHSSYTIDKELLWVPKDYYAKLDVWQGKEPSIVFMGCSCTEFGKYDSFLKEIIDSVHPGNDFTFVNFGVGGWSSYQGLQQLQRDVLSMRPRVVTIFYGWNDHWCTFGIEDKDIGKYNLEHSTLVITLHRFRVVQLVNRVIFRIRQSGGERERKPERVSLPDFTSNLHEMVRVARESNITPILITAPSSHREGEEPAYLTERWLSDLNDLVPLHQRYAQAVRNVSLADNVAIVDLALEFSKLPRADLDEYFGKDGIHLTAEGDKRIAELMYGYFLNSGLIDQVIMKDQETEY
jgi:lysophospholipase L1-like esterase